MLTDAICWCRRWRKTWSLTLLNLIPSRECPFRRSRNISGSRQTWTKWAWNGPTSKKDRLLHRMFTCRNPYLTTSMRYSMIVMIKIFNTSSRTCTIINTLRMLLSCLARWWLSSAKVAIIILIKTRPWFQVKFSSSPALINKKTHDSR